MVVEVTKMIKPDDLQASQYLNQTVYGISGYVLGVLEEIRTSSSGEQEFWVRNTYGLIQIFYFYIE